MGIFEFNTGNKLPKREGMRMDKEHIEPEEYSHSPNEYRTRIDDYNLNVQEFKIVLENNSQQEFGSQPQSEFNEYVQQVRIKPKKSKFKKMMQYLVAGVAGAIIITNNVGPTTANKSTELIVMPIEYDTYTVMLSENGYYIITFDDNKLDEYCDYLAEYIYKLSIYVDRDYIGDEVDVKNRRIILNNNNKFAEETYIMHGFKQFIGWTKNEEDIETVKKLLKGESVDNNKIHSGIGTSIEYNGEHPLFDSESVYEFCEYIDTNYKNMSKREIRDKLWREIFEPMEGQTVFYCDRKDGGFSKGDIHTEDVAFELPTFMKITLEVTYDD